MLILFIMIIDQATLALLIRLAIKVFLYLGMLYKNRFRIKDTGKEHFK